jgi:hypothetical protein
MLLMSILSLTMYIKSLNINFEYFYKKSKKIMIIYNNFYYNKKIIRVVDFIFIFIITLFIKDINNAI